jgi:tetratricopeptide (TPR) repeat protein
MMSRNPIQPYVGARPFKEADQYRFFGRAAESATLAELWRDNRIVYVAGNAGSGKTSLLNAGVLPLLADSKLDILPVGHLSCGTTFPFAALPPHNPYTLALLRSWSPGEAATRLVGETISNFMDRPSGHRPVLAAIDPFDELLADSGPRRFHRKNFLAELAEALRATSRLHVLIVGREEAISEATGALGGGIRYEVGGLTWHGAADAVSKPMAKTRAIEKDAVERLVVDLRHGRARNPDHAESYVTGERIAPGLLQVACAYLASSLPAGSAPVTVEDVREYADVDTALATHLGIVVSEVAEDHGLNTGDLRSWLLGNFVTELGTRGKAYEGATMTAGMPNAVARELEDRHLLIARPESGTRWYELLDERLIRPLRLIQPLRDAPDVPRPTGRPDRYLPMAKRAMTAGDPDLAEKYAGEILRDAPETSHQLLAETYSLLGNLAFERDNFKEAEEFYRKAMERFEAISNTREVAFQLAAAGQMLLAQGHLTEATEMLRSATIRLPNDLAIRVAYALALWQLGESRAAKAEATMALNIDGGNIPALTARGEILADLGEARDALRDLDRVPADGKPQVRAAKGLALTMVGDHQDARKELRLAISEGRNNGPALLYAARAYALVGDADSAADLARQSASAADPPLVVPHRAIARRLMDAVRSL